MKTGLIGLGAMGQGMARRLAGAGYLTAIYNRTASKAEQLGRDLDVNVCYSPGELAAMVDVILICVSADHDVLAVVEAISQTLRPGVIVVDMSTVSNVTAKRAADILKAKQAAFLDAPVSGGVEGANKGTLAMMVGGEAGVLAKVKPVLASMTSRVSHMGATGAGQATKAVNQIMCAGINQAVTEALAFGQAQDLPMDKIIEVISAGAAGNWFLQHRGLTMTNGTFKPGFKLNLHQKDLLICLDMAEKCGFPLPLTKVTADNYDQLIREGYGDEDISVLYRLKRR